MDIEAAVAANFKLILLAVAFVTVFVVWAVRSVINSMGVERSRRELFAYVAEGTLTVDDARRLLEASDFNNVRARVADGVAWGVVGAKDAASIFNGSSSESAPKDCGANEARRAARAAGEAAREAAAAVSKAFKTEARATPPSR